MGTRILKKSGRNSDDSETVQDCHSVYYATHSHTLTRTHTRGSIIVFDQERRKWILLGRIFHWENGEQSYTQAESFCETNVFFLFCWRHESLYIDITRTQLNSRDEEMERKQNVHSFYLFWETGSFDAGQKCQRRNKTTTLRRGPEDKVWWTNRSVSNMAAVQERKKHTKNWIRRQEHEQRPIRKKRAAKSSVSFFHFFFSKNPALNTRRPSLKTFVYQSVCVCTLGTETVWGHLEQNARPSSFFCWFRRNRCVRGAVHKANDRPLTSHTGHGVVWRGSLMTSPSNAPLFLLWNCVYNSSFCFYFKAFRPKTIRIDSNKCW